MIVARLLEQVRTDERPEAQQAWLRSAAEKLRQVPRVWLAKEEAKAFDFGDEAPERMLIIEETLSATLPRQALIYRLSGD